MPLLVLWAVLLLPANTQIIASISADSYVAGATANYTIDMIEFFGITVPANSKIIVAFPEQFNATALHQGTTYVGSGSGCGGACTGVTIGYQGTSFTLDGVFPSAYSSALIFNYKISAIVNPPYAGAAGTFYFTIFEGTTIYYTATANLPSSFSARVMAYSTQVMMDRVLGVSPLKVTLWPQSAVDEIRFQLPSSWSNETVVTTAFTTGDLSCSSESNPGLVCNLLGTYRATSLDYKVGGEPIDITINYMYNPSSVAQIGNILTTGYVGGSATDTCTIELAPSNFSPEVLRDVTSTITYQAGDLIDVQLQFFLPGTSLADDKINVTLPSTLATPTLTASYAVQVKNVAVSPAITIETSTNSISFSPFTSSEVKASVTLTMSSIARPRQCLPTGTFHIQTLRSTHEFLVESTHCCSNNLQNRDTLVLNSLALSNSDRLATGVTYTFNFTTSAVDLDTGDAIVLVFPPEYSSQITNANQAAICASVTLTSVTNAVNMVTPTCAVGLNRITLSSFLNADETTVATLLMAVGGMTNPSATPTSGFQLATTNGDYVLEQNMGITLSISPTLLTTFSVTPASTVAYA